MTRATWESDRRSVQPLTASSAAFDRPLRIGVTLDSLTVAAWIAEILRRLRDCEFVQLALVVVNVEATSPTPRFARLRAPSRRHILFELYERVDAWRFSAEPDAFAQVDAAHELDSTSPLVVVPQRPALSEQRFPADVIRTVREADLDVLLHLGVELPRGEILRCARHGVWSYHHGDIREYRGGPPFFWEMYDGNPVSGTTLQVLADECGGGRILYRSFSATDPSSLYRGRNAAYWKSAAFVIRRLTDLQRWGWTYLESRPEYSEAVQSGNGIRGTPTNTQMARFLTRLLTTTVARKARKLVCREVWYVGYRRTARGPSAVAALTSARPASPAERFRLLSSPAGRYYADPFVAEHDGRYHVLFEDCDAVTGKGVISSTCFDDDGVPRPATTVLERDHHLSYPFVFRSNGEWYMVPESAEHGTISLFRADDFPTRWVLARVLLDEISAVDPTILEYDGRFWLFANVAAPGASIADELFLFYADSLLGEWTPHPMSPVVSDVRRARPAGRVISDNGVLIRPAQDSSCGYGHAIVFNRIITLTPTEYEETPVYRLEPGWMPGNVATHTFNAQGDYEVVDARRRVFKGIPSVPWRRDHA